MESVVKEKRHKETCFPGSGQSSLSLGFRRGELGPGRNHRSERGRRTPQIDRNFPSAGQSIRTSILQIKIGERSGVRLYATGKFGFDCEPIVKQSFDRHCKEVMVQSEMVPITGDHPVIEKVLPEDDSETRISILHEIAVNRVLGASALGVMADSLH